MAGYLAGNITIGNATATSFRSNNFLYSNGVSILSGISATPSLNSLSGNISWTASGFGTPTFNTSSVGSKLILWPQVNSTNVDYAVGIESGFTWFSIPQATNSFGYKWYAGTSNIASLYGNGALIVTNGVYSNSYNYANGVSILTGISGTYSNANVASYLPTYSGNITAGNVIVNGNIPMTSNVARYTWVANVAPTSGQGSVGDIWYQTF